MSFKNYLKATFVRLKQKRTFLKEPFCLNENSTSLFVLTLFAQMLLQQTERNNIRQKYSRFRLIGPPVNRVSRLIGPNC